MIGDGLVCAAVQHVVGTVVVVIVMVRAKLIYHLSVSVSLQELLSLVREIGFDQAFTYRSVAVSGAGSRLEGQQN